MGDFNEIILNCRGLGNQWPVQELHTFVRFEAPQVLFLMETRLSDKDLEWLRCRLGFVSCLGVDRIRTGGRLALFWSNDIKVSAISYSTFHIDAMVADEEGTSWRFNGFYGNPVTSNHFRSWQLLRSLHTQSSVSWLVMEDFNEITNQREKLG